MISLIRNQVLSCTSPLLDLYYQVAGQLTDVAELSFEIFDVSTDEKLATPVEIVGTTAVDVGTTCPDPGAGRVSLGRFFAEWTVPGAEPFGRHRIRWTVKLTAESAEEILEEDFEVLSTASRSPISGYALVADFRDEGVTVTEASDARIQLMIVQASRRIERLTGQWFEPRAMLMELDGTGSRRLGLEVPIIAAATVVVDGEDIDADAYKIYNRHLSGVGHPDDRDDPRLQFVTSSLGSGSSFVINNVARFRGSRVWTRGEQNVVIDGVFGYTDPPGPQGSTPELIRHATKLLAMKELPTMTDDERLDRQLRRRVTLEKTRDQTIGFAKPVGGSSGYLTGDEEIDQILEQYMGSMGVGSA